LWVVIGASQNPTLRHDDGFTTHDLTTHDFSTSRATPMSHTFCAVIAEARTWIGTPYRHQASLKGVGCDCLGLVRGVWRGVTGAEPERAPPYSPDWAEAGSDALLDAACRLLTATDRVRPGAVLVFRWRKDLPAKHCAVATGDATMIHAHDGAAVAEVAFRPWWQRHLAGVFSFPFVAAE
jgi:NlpC/P60 family putative phage cell wall peptidase